MHVLFSMHICVHSLLVIQVRGGFDAVKATDQHGCHALLWAAGNGHLRVCQWLCSDEVGCLAMRCDCCVALLSMSLGQQVPYIFSNRRKRIISVINKCSSSCFKLRQVCDVFASAL